MFALGDKQDFEKWATESLGVQCALDVAREERQGSMATILVRRAALSQICSVKIPRTPAWAGRTAYCIDFLRGIRSGRPLWQIASDAFEDRNDLPAVGVKLTHKSSMIEDRKSGED